MPDLRRISFIACFLLVVVRMSIGWQFLYEGLWKLEQVDTPKPWSAAGYLKNAQGPFRDHYRNMTGDPDDLSWLDAELVAARWDEWHQRLLARHPDLTDKQKQQLDDLINGKEDFRAVLELEQLPEGVEFRGSLGAVIRFDAVRERLIVDGKRHLAPREKAALLKKVSIIPKPDAESGETLSEADREKNKIAEAYQKAVNEVYARSARLCYKERLIASLKGDPERAGEDVTNKAGDVVEVRKGDIELYRESLARYDVNLAKAEQAFQHDHLKKQWAELQQLRSRVVGPIKAMQAEMMLKAGKLLTTEQLARGPVPMPETEMDRVNRQTIWALTILGALLIVGLLSRLAALGAAGLLLSFYMAMPPWPGIVEYLAATGPEHSLIVNKNLIEIFALLAIASMPTGRWFGIDAFLSRLFRQRPGKSTAHKTKERAVASSAG